MGLFSSCPCRLVGLFSICFFSTAGLFLAVCLDRWVYFQLFVQNCGSISNCLLRPVDLFCEGLWWKRTSKCWPVQWNVKMDHYYIEQSVDTKQSEAGSLIHFQLTTLLNGGNRWKDNIREWAGLEFAKSQRTMENREERKKQAVRSSVVPQRLLDRLRWWRWLN